MLRQDIMDRMNTHDRITPSPSAGAIQNQSHHQFDNDAFSVCPTSGGVSVFRCNVCGKSFGVWAQIQMHIETHGPAKSIDTKGAITNEPDCSYGLSNPQQMAKFPSLCVDEQKLLDVMNRTEKMTDSSFEPCRSDPGFPRASDITETSSSNTVTTVKPHVCSSLMDQSEINFLNRQCKPVENTNTVDPLTLYICTICGTSFKTKLSLDSHLAEHKQKIDEKHRDEPTFGCNLCSKSFTAQELFEEHMNLHRMDRAAAYMTYTAHSDMPYSCNICREGFESLDELRAHISVHTHNISSGAVKNKCFACQICDISCSTWEQLKSHVSKHESVVVAGQGPSEGKQFQCEKCKKSFSVWGHLKAHLMRHQNEALSKNYIPGQHGSPVFNCEVCEKVFVAKSHLLGHMKTHTDPVACETCGKLFQTQQHVNRHKVMHTGERPHKCDVCGMRFMRKEHCKRHIMTHISDKSLLASCEICDKSFSRPEHLQRHYRMHTGEKPFKCDICEKQYSRKDRLQHHLKSHEREVRQVLSESESVSDSTDYNFSRFSAQNVSESSTVGSGASITTQQRIQNGQTKTSLSRLNVNVFNKSPPVVTSATVLSSVGLVSSSAVSKMHVPSDEGGSIKSSVQMSSTRKTSPSNTDQHDVSVSQSSSSYREDGSASTISPQNISSNLSSNDRNDHNMRNVYLPPSLGHTKPLLGGNMIQSSRQNSVGSYNPSCLPLTIESMTQCKSSFASHLSKSAGNLVQTSQSSCSSLSPGSGRNVAHSQLSFAPSLSMSVHCDDQPLHGDRYAGNSNLNVMTTCMDNRLSNSQGMQRSLNNPQIGDTSRK